MGAYTVSHTSTAKPNKVEYNFFLSERKNTPAHLYIVSLTNECGSISKNRGSG